MAENTEIQTAQILQPGSNMPLKGSPSYDEILGFVEGKFNEAKQARLQFERQWYLNLAFYAGKQYAQWTGQYGTASSRLVDVPSPDWKPRLVINHVKRYVRKEHAKATKEDPTGWVFPASGDESDIAAAKAADQILEHVIRENKFYTVKRQAAWWACVTGNGFIKDWYQRKNPTEDSIGDIPVAKSVSPFHIFVPDVVEQDIEGQEAVYQVGAKSIDQIRMMYPDVEDLATVSRDSGSSGMEERFFQSIGVRETNQKNIIYVREAWIRPCTRYPEGLVIHWTPGTILWMQEGWPYSHGQFPYAKLDHIPTGRFYTDSIITDLISPQKEYNRTRSQIIESKNRMANPQMAYQQGSVDTTKVTSRPGQWIPYKPGFDKPGPLELQHLPSYVLQEVDRNKMDMDDISSQHEVSNGNAPPGVEAATAISYLQEQDDTVLSELTHSIEQAVEKTCRHFLEHVQQNWDLPRKVQVTGLNSQLEAYEFDKKAIEGANTYVVTIGSAAPRSAAAKQAQIMESMKNGWIPPTLGFKLLDQAETGKIYEELQVDSRQAQRENLKMNDGFGLPQPESQMTLLGPMEGQLNLQQLMMDPTFQGFPTNSWDDDLVHIEEHDRWRKRQEFESSPPEIKFLFERHQLFHKRRLAVNLGQMLPPPGTDPGLEAAYLDSIVFKVKNGIPLAPVLGSEGQSEGQQQEGQPEGP